MNPALLTLFTLALAGLAGDTTSPDSAARIGIGEVAPDFEFLRHHEDGTAVPARLSDLRGKNVMIAFYPKAFSQGCTRQLNDFQGATERFDRNGFELITISGDPQRIATRFRDANDYSFSVVGNFDQDIIRHYGVPTRTYLGNEYAQRCVFLIDAEGIIRYADRDYQVLGDNETLWATIDGLGAQWAAAASSDSTAKTDCAATPANGPSQ